MLGLSGLFSVKIGGVEDAATFILPSNQQYEFNYVTVNNITDNIMTVQTRGISTDSANEIIPAMATRCIHIKPDWRTGFDLGFTNPGSTNPTVPKNFQLYFTEEDTCNNMQYV
jgi:hypothetical protein